MRNGIATLGINVPGPVVDAYLVWAGVADLDDAGTPLTNDLFLNGTQVVGTLVDQTPTTDANPDWHVWRADVGPGGYDLVHSGANTFAIEGWFPAPNAQTNGASIVVLYSTGACANWNQIQALDGIDWFWAWDRDAQITSDLMVYDVLPAPYERLARITFFYAGADSASPTCKGTGIWYASGTGSPPAAIVQPNIGGSMGINGGVLIAQDALSAHGPGYPCVPVFNAPATAMTTSYDPEWTVAALTVRVPAGASWLAFQLESPLDRDGDNGAWVGGGPLVIELQAPDVALTSKSDGVTEALPGDFLTYVISYANLGGGEAGNVTIVDTLPERTSFVSCDTPVGACSAVGRTVTFDLGSLAPGTSGAVQVRGRLDQAFPTGTTELTNVAQISTSSPGDDLTNNSASDTTSVTVVPVLLNVKVDSPDPVDAGSRLEYRINWEVTGQAFAEGVVLTDTLPTDVTFVQATGGGVYNPTTHTITWNLGSVAPPRVESFLVRVDVKSPLFNGTVLTNRARLSDASGQSAAATTTSTVRSSHTLLLTKAVGATGGNPPRPRRDVVPGSLITYTLSWAVTGNEPATNVVITDTIPPHTTFVSASHGGTLSNGTVIWNLGARVDPPASGSVTLVVRVDSPLFNGTQIANVGCIDDTDVDTASACDSTTVNVVSSHQLVVLKTDSPDPVDAGELLTYTINWSVTGDEPSTNLVITDAVPANTTFVSASHGGALSNGIVTWNLGAQVDPPASGSVTLVVRVNSPLLNGTKLQNTAVIDDSDVDTNSDSDTIETTVRSSHQLVVSKSDSPDPVDAGSQLTYVINWQVTGNEPALSAMLQDTLPAHTTFVSASAGGTVSNGVVTWNLGTQNPPASGSVTLVVAVESPLTNGTVLNNAVTLSDSTPSSTPGQGSATTTVRSKPELSLTKTNNPGPTTDVTPGDTIQYTLCYRNSGNENATGTLLTDVIPQFTSYVAGSATGGGSYNASTKTLTWNIGTLVADGAQHCVSFTVQVNMIIEGLTGQALGARAIPYRTWSELSINNTAELDSNQTTPITASATNKLIATVDPVIYKSVNKSTAVPDDDITYVITVTNRGNATATGVVVTEQVPQYLTFVRPNTSKGTALWNEGTRTVTVDIGTLAPGEVVEIQVTATVGQPTKFPATLTNTALISFNEGTARESNSVTVTVEAPVPEIPEPSTWLLLLGGLTGAAGYARLRLNSRRRRKRDV